MAKNSKIEWTDHTANLWWGCQKVHSGCDHCYAEALDNRWSGNHWGPKTTRRPIKGVWTDLARFQKEASESGTTARVFVGSMMDIFEKPMPLDDGNGGQMSGSDTGHLRSMLFQQIGSGLYPNLIFLFLTKRPGNILKMIPDRWRYAPPKNIMYGTSIVDQETAERMVPELLQVPGKHFLSMEPLLGPVNLRQLKRMTGTGQKTLNSLTGIEHFDDIDTSKHNTWAGKVDWVIVGGESGHHARPMHPDWVRSILTQCTRAETPFFFKQWGEWIRTPVPVPKVEAKFISPHTYFSRVGKKDAGRVLDGETWNQLPIINQ